MRLLRRVGQGAALVLGDAARPVLTLVGLPGLLPLPWWQTLAIFTYAMLSCLVVNDTVKVALIKWRVPNAVAKQPGRCDPRKLLRAYQLYEQRGGQDGQAAGDWAKAEQEIRKNGPGK